MKTLFLGASNLGTSVVADAAKQVAMKTKSIVKKDVEFGTKASDYIGVSTRMAGAEGSCYPEGICSNPTLVGNYTLFDKEYTIDDSIVLRALAVYSSKMLEGDYITVITNVKDKKPLYRDEVNVSYKSAANGGKSGTDCGPFDPSGSIDIITNKCIHTFFLYVEVAVCYKSLVGSFQQRLLNEGQLYSEENDALNNRILDEIIRSNARQTDRLIWKGDMGSANDDICHYDGLIKKAFQASTAITYHSLKFVFTGVLGGTECLEVRYGGETHQEAFDTDTATTIANLAAWIAGLNDAMSGTALATVAFNGTDELTVTSNFRRYQLEIEIQSSDCTSGIECVPTGSVTVVETTLQAYKVGDAPILTPYVNITAANVLVELEKIYLAAATEHPTLISEDDFMLHVSPEVWAAVKVASVKLTGAFMGVNGNQDNPNPFGMMIVEQPGMVGTKVIFGTRRSNIYFGTDLVSDMTNTQQWVNKDCQEVRMRHESRQGVQIDRFDEVVANLDGAPFTFQAAQTEDCTAVGSC